MLPLKGRLHPGYLFKIPVGVFRWDGHSFRGDQCQGVKPQNFGLFLQIGGDVFYLRILRERIAQQMKRPLVGFKSGGDITGQLIGHITGIVLSAVNQGSPQSGSVPNHQDEYQEEDNGHHTGFEHPIFCGFL